MGLALACEGVIIGAAFVTQGPDVLLGAVVHSDIISYTDRARVSAGGRPLVESELLTQAAQAKAEDMAARGYFSHTGPDGEEPWVWIELAGYAYQYAGENLAVRFEDSKDIVDAWMDSPGHRANIVKPHYTNIGVGIAEGEYQGAPATFVVQYFAAPASGPAPRAEAPSEERVSQAVPQEAAVAGAQTPPDTESSAPTQTLTQSLRHSAGALLSESRTVAGWVLVALAAVLSIVIALAFFVRIQVQPTDLLVPGAAVAVMVGVFLSVNAHYLGGSQAAGVAMSVGDIGEGVSVEVAPRFPDAPLR